MKLFIADESRERFHLPKSSWVGDSFNEKFDTETGEETVSILVPEICVHMIDEASKKDDAKGVIAYYACCWMGRVADLPRVLGCGARLLENGRIELRLKFGPPWYWSHVQNAIQRAARQGEKDTRTARVDRAVSPI